MTKNDEVKSNLQILVMAWKITGGWKAVVFSADFWVSIFIWVLCAPYWVSFPWWDQVISVFPNVLGFTLGGFAIFLGFGSESFKRVLSHEDEMKSPYLSVSAAFLIFLFFQIITLLYAFVAKSLHIPTPLCLSPYLEWINKAEVISSGIGYFLSVYSLNLAFKAGMRVFRLSRWYHALINVEIAEDKVKAAASASTKNSAV